MTPKAGYKTEIKFLKPICEIGREIAITSSTDFLYEILNELFSRLLAILYISETSVDNISHHIVIRRIS